MTNWYQLNTRAIVGIAIAAACCIATPCCADLLLLEVDTNHVLRVDETTNQLRGVFAQPDIFDGNPADMILGPDGNLYFTDFQRHRILRHRGDTGAFIDVFADTEAAG